MHENSFEKDFQWNCPCPPDPSTCTRKYTWSVLHPNRGSQAPMAGSLCWSKSSTEDATQTKTEPGFSRCVHKHQSDPQNFECFHPLHETENPWMCHWYMPRTRNVSVVPCNNLACVYWLPALKSRIPTTNLSLATQALFSPTSSVACRRRQRQWSTW